MCGFVCVCVCVFVCVCVRAHERTCLLVCGLDGCVGVRARWREREGERGREREEGGSLRVSVCATVRYDLFRLFFKCTFSPIILRKTKYYSIMFHTYVFTNVQLLCI